MKVNDPADHALHIDEQARFDLSVSCIAECHNWEAMRDAIQRAVDFWPNVVVPKIRLDSYGIQLE